MAQGRSTKTISMIEWIRTSRLSIKNSLLRGRGLGSDQVAANLELELDLIGVPGFGFQGLGFGGLQGYLALTKRPPP